MRVAQITMTTTVKGLARPLGQPNYALLTGCSICKGVSLHVIFGDDGQR